jgi:hypothetical protein
MSLQRMSDIEVITKLKAKRVLEENNIPIKKLKSYNITTLHFLKNLVVIEKDEKRILFF